jgi:hypothetical protein
MRWLIWYLKSCFCQHNWKLEEMEFTYTPYMYDDITHTVAYGKESTRFRVDMLCTKCGWHKAHLKFHEDE